MKRGNTALKRAVSVTSVAAMAIAGAVLAAPSASAALPTATDVVRAQPIANANQIDANGNAVSSPIPFITGYGATASATARTTGNLPTIQAGVKGQRVSNLQVKIPATANTEPWLDGESYTVTLPVGVTVNGTVSASVSPALVDLATLGADAQATAYSPAAGAQTPSMSVTAAGSVLTVKFSADAAKAPTTLPSTGTPGYVLNISGLYVDVADTVAGPAPVTASVESVTAPVAPATAGTATAVGVTTLGYVSGLSLSSAGSYSANAKTTTVPDISLSESVKTALAAAPYTLTVSSVPAAPAASPVTVTGVGTFTVTGSSTSAPSAATAAIASGTDSVVVTPTATDPAALETVTLSGLTVKNVPNGAKLVVTLSSPNGGAVNFSNDIATHTASSFSYAPAQSSLPTVSISSTVAPPRTAGVNRYDTAAKVAQMGSWSGKAVVLANGLDVKQGVDALSANFLAGAKQAPVLLTDSSNTLPTATQLALTRLFSGQTGDLTIYVMGKTDSVSQAAQDAAKAIVKAAANTSANVTVKDIAGANRYATSAAVVTEASSSIRAYDLGAGTYRTAFLASGVVNADALAAGGFSAGAGIPVLLVQDGAKTVSDEVAAAIKSANIGQVIVLGGTDRVSDDVVKQLKDSLNISNVVREQGTDRYITAADINTLAFTAAPKGLGLVLNGQTAYLASGAAGWPDALTVGPLAGQQKAPVLTVPVDSLPAAASAFLSTNKANINAIDALGGTDRIADSVVTAAQAAIQ